MKSNMIKIFTLIILIGMMVPLLNYTFNYETQAKNFDTTPYENVDRDSTTGTNRLNDIGKIIVGLLRGFGTVISVAVLIVIGLRYMVGSVEDKAEYKKSMFPYVIGAVMVFSITNLLAIIVEIAGAI